MSPYTSKRSPIATRRRRSCCARATARAARACPGAGRGQEAHLAEPFRLAGGPHRRLQDAAQRRHRHLSGPASHYHHPLAAAWACRGRPRHGCKIGLDRLLGPEGNRCRDLVLALVGSRLLEPGSKLAAARALSPDTASSSLGQQLGLGVVDEDELYTALDWLAVRQPAIERALARNHLTGGTLVLYDVSSSYMEGRCCPLAQYGYNRDRKRGKLQIVYGLLCAPNGCPVAIEVFEGSTADPMTLSGMTRRL
jgi:hypothetical protein